VPPDAASAGPLEDFLRAEAAGLCHVDYWRAVARLWAGSDRTQRRSEAWTAMWSRAAIAPGAQLSLMTDDERAALAALGDEVTVHRGFAGEDWRGWDWTPARAFAERQALEAAGSQPGSQPRVATATVDRERIVALFDAGRAMEVILATDDVAPQVSPVADARRGAGPARRDPS
jgi:hypothetical protein